MADRRVTHIRKDKDGDITELCNPGDAWSPRKKADAISDIEDKTHTYHVKWPGEIRTEVNVVNGQNGKYLRTDRDNSTHNNLDDLPDC